MKMTEIGYFLGECWNVWDDFVNGKCSQVRRNRPYCGRFRYCKGCRPFAGHHSSPRSSRTCRKDHPPDDVFAVALYPVFRGSCVSGFYGNYGEGAYSPSILDIPSSAPPYRTSIVTSWNAFIMPFRWRLYYDGCRRSEMYALLGISGGWCLFGIL